MSGEFFLANISHELRNPLGGIIGYSQLLSQTKLDITQQGYVNNMNACCLQLVELVNDILDFSKLTSNKAQLNSECFAFREVLDEINSAIGYRIAEKKQKFHTVIDNKLPEYIITDKQKLLQILINLISNANKFTPTDGQIILDVSLKDDMLDFSVEDNGIGISKEDQSKLFNPFVQVQESATKNGSGLGLAICKRLVEFLGGKIYVESDKGEGAIFRFNIKYENYEDFKKSVEKNRDMLKNKWVLIADSTLDSRESLADILFDYDTRPIFCSSAKETIKMLSRSKYNFICIILDISMDIPGTDFVKTLKELVPNLPVVAISSLDTSVGKFDHVINRPIHPLKLIDTLIRIVGKNDISSLQLNDVEEEKVVSNVTTTRILIAEDMQYNLDMLVKMLQNMGYQNVDTAKDGEEAIRKLSDGNRCDGNRYDILLLDLRMPKVDGISVAQFIKGKCDDKTFIPPKIAVITASVLDSDREKCRELGIKYFLLKPFNITQLRCIMQKLVNGTQQKLS